MLCIELRLDRGGRRAASSLQCQALIPSDMLSQAVFCETVALFIGGVGKRYVNLREGGTAFQ